MRAIAARGRSAGTDGDGSRIVRSEDAVGREGDLENCRLGVGSKDGGVEVGVCGSEEDEDSGRRCGRHCVERARN